MRGRRITWGDDLGWLSWRWCWWLFSVALRWRWPGSLMTAAVLPLRDVETPVCVFSPLPVCFFCPLFFLLPVCLSRSPCQYPYCFGPFSLNTIGLSLSLGPPSCFLQFFFLGSLFIGAGGAGLTLPRPIAAHAWGARLLLWHDAGRGANGGVACGARLLWHLIMRQVASGFSFNRARGIVAATVFAL